MMTHRTPSKRSSDKWDLCLYVLNQTQKSMAAFANLKKLCEEYLPGKYTIEVVDLAKHPERARSDQIVAIPTLIRRRPSPMRMCIGDLSNLEGVPGSLDLCRS
jgi:circadian clock protein KaiB